MKNFIFVAPPAAGKGTQSKKICETYQIPHISMGDLLREEIKSNTLYGRELETKMKQGLLIDDDIILTILKRRLVKEDCKKGYILDGYPRNLRQASEYDMLLNELNKKLDAVIVMDLDFENAKLRTLGRINCPNCGYVYNLSSSSLNPKMEGICDFCHHTLERRKDDRIDTLNTRYKVYDQETRPLITYYESRGLVYHIDSTKNADEVFSDIKKVLGDV